MNPAALRPLTEAINIRFLLFTNKPQSLGLPPVCSELVAPLCVWGVLGSGNSVLSLLPYLKDSQSAPGVPSQHLWYF